jgi:hypothetical protein
LRATPHLLRERNRVVHSSFCFARQFAGKLKNISRALPSTNRTEKRTVFSYATHRHVTSQGYNDPRSKEALHLHASEVVTPRGASFSIHPGQGVTRPEK